MKKANLLILLLLCFLNLKAQTNLIKDGNMTGTGANLSTPSSMGTISAGFGWAVYWGSADPQKCLSIQSVIDGGNGQGAVVKITAATYGTTGTGMNSDVLNNARLVERLSTILAGSLGTYNVKFKAKATNATSTQMTVSLRSSASNTPAYVLDGYSGTETPAHIIITLTQSWADYSVNFDLTKTVGSFAVNSATSPVSTNQQPIVCFGMNNSSLSSPAQEYMIDDVTIIKGKGTVIVATGSTSYIYNGSAQGPTTSTVIGSTGAITYSYSGTGGTTYSATPTRPTNAGTYQVIASVAADATYLAATSIPYAFTIAKATATVAAVTDTKTYDETTSSSASPTVGALASGDVINAAPIQTYDNKNYGTTHVLTPAGLTIKNGSNADMTANYNITYTPSPATGVINQIALSIGAPSIAPKSYDGSQTSGTVTAGTLSGFLSPETVTVSNAVGTYTDANVGTGKSATIVYTLADGIDGNGGLAVNYSLDNGSATGDITAATITLNSGSTINASSYTSPQLANSDLVVSSGEFVVDQSTATVKSVTVAPGAKLSLGSNTLNATNGITLQSDASGTATLMDSYSTPTINASVQQYVTAGRNWYMSAPLNNSADYTVLDKGASVAEYNEVTGLWPAVTSGTLTRGKGYVQVASATQGSNGTVSFNGTTNSGDVSVTLTNTSGKGNGFNLVGNPYPSYLSWSAVAADNTAANMPTGTMWYRTISYNGNSAWAPNTVYSLNNIVYNGTRFYKVTTAGTSAASGGPTGGVGSIGIGDGTVIWAYEGSIYIFATINAAGVPTPSTVSNLIPPVQAFWVKSTGGTLIFKNAMRSHNTGGTNALKAPKNLANDIKLLRLNVSNGASADEAVIYASADASNGFDSYDAPKYFNLAGSNQPEIYTQVGSEKLVINAMSELNQGTEIPLGFATEKGNDFTISASEFRNFSSDMQVILKDKQANTEYDLLNGQGYKFSSSVVNDANRFSLIFRTSGNTTNLNSLKKLNVQVFVNSENQIVIESQEKATVFIYDVTGQKQYESMLTSTKTTINKAFGSGVYFVAISVNGQSEIQKLIIR